jgi:xanthine dehydrogenase YagS FAD-binding subunit
MQPFSYRIAASIRDAVDAVRTGSEAAPPSVPAHAQFIAGGTNMIDYMRLDVARPETLVDINRLTESDCSRIEANGNGLRLGALVRMSAAEDHPVVRRDYPVIHDTLRLAASRQVRNMATLGGNLLQRTRCAYFRENSWACNKRNPGAGCAAVGGATRQHAVLATSEHCIATYAGDFAQALIALDASIEIDGPGGRRTIAVADLHRPPGDTPQIETVLEPGELIASIHVPAGPWTRRSRYVKVRDRDSYQFAIVSAAVALDLDGGLVRDARVALGGVATVPWRARAAEAVLRNAPLDEDSATAAAEAAFADARAQGQNAFKIPLGKLTVVRALLEVNAMDVP